VSTPAEAMDKLQKLSRELGSLSTTLAQVNQALEPVGEEYEKFLDDFETGLWFKHETEGAKLPPKDMRIRLAHKAMSPELLGQYHGLTNKRDRLRKAISDKKADVDAWRSMLSALKVEMSAMEGR
jgi:predicted  nucleic acid-binding Zn-ribbon protein